MALALHREGQNHAFGIEVPYMTPTCVRCHMSARLYTRARITVGIQRRCKQLAILGTVCDENRQFAA